MIIHACTTFWIPLYIQSHFNPLQNHFAEHFACHVKYHDLMPFFAAAQVAKWTRGRRHNINEDFYIVVLRFFFVER